MVSLECEVPRSQTGSAGVVGWSPSERIAGDICTQLSTSPARPTRNRLGSHVLFLACCLQTITVLRPRLASANIQPSWRPYITLVCVMVSYLHGAKWSRHVEVSIDVSGAFTFDHEAQVSLCSSGIWGSLLLPDSPALTLCLLSNRQPRLRLYSGWVTSG